MSNNFKKYIAVLLVLAVCGGVFFVKGRDNKVEAAKMEGSFNVLSYNVGGLPAIISSSSPAEYTQQISPKLNDYDIINVQEDFGYNSKLVSKLNLPYKTDFSGNVPKGDGLMTFSKFPLYMESRVAWKDTHGFITDGADQMIPKGFCYTSVEIEKGYFIDIYNLHTDADCDEKSMAARRSNMSQLAEYISERSSGRAVIVFGDTNSRYTREGDDFNELIVEKCGLTDAWVEHVLGGVKPSKGDSLMVDKLGQKGEVVDKIWYRSGKNIDLKAMNFKLLQTEFTDKDGNQLSDHYPITSEFNYKLNNQYMTTDTFGGGGGKGFSFLDKMDDKLPSKVMVSTGNRVDNVGFVYSDKEVTIGGDGGDKQVLELEDGEYIESVKVSKAKKTSLGTNRISYICIATNKGNKIEGGTYDEKNSMEFVAPNGYAIAGFIGTYGDEIDRIGCIYQLI